MLLRNIPDSDPDIFVAMTTVNRDQGYHDGHTADNDNNHVDDVWGDDGDENATTTAAQSQDQGATSHPSDVPRLQREHTTAGYRDGVTTAKAVSVQAGFDEGFGLGATIGVRAGQLLGMLEGIAAAVSIQNRKKDGVVSLAEECLQSLLIVARGELAVQTIFGEPYWAQDGTWKYEVPEPVAVGDDGHADVVFSDVAAAHPLLRKWDEIVRAETERYGVDWEVLHDEAVEERRREEELGHDHAKPADAKGSAAQRPAAMEW